MATTDQSRPPPRAAGRLALPPRPTGRRRVTPTQIRNTADLSGRFETVSHWRVLAVFKMRVRMSVASSFSALRIQRR